MSVLETIYIQFKSDSKEVKKGAEDAKKSTVDLEKGLMTTKDAAASMGKSFSDSILSAQRNITAMLTVSALTAKTLRESGQAEELGRFAERLGQDAEQVALWGKMAEQAGGSAEGFRGVLDGLINTLTEFSITGGGAAAEVFARLGINAFNAGGQLKDAFSLLPEIADSFQNLSDTESSNLGAKLGLDNATILLLQRGRSEIEQLTARQQYLGITTREDTEIAEAFGRAWRDTQTAVGSFARTIGFALIPILTDAQSIVQNTFVFLRENQDFIGDVFKATAAVISAVYLPVMIKTGLATIAALLPFIAIGSVIGLLAIAWNDLNAYMEGGDSIIGRLAERFPMVTDAIEKAAEIIKTLKENIGEFFNDLSDYFSGNAVRAFNTFLSLIGLKEEQEPVRQQPQNNQGGAAGGGGTQSDLPPMILPDYTAPEGVRTTIEEAGQLAAAATTTNNSSTETTINIGDIDINLQEGNAEEIAQQLPQEIEKAMAKLASPITG